MKSILKLGILWHRLTARCYYLRGITHRYMGHRYSNRKEYRLAINDLSRAIQLDPGLTQALYDRALLYWREIGDGHQAEQDLTQVIAENPELAEAWFNRALARQLTGEIKGAIADFQTYLAKGEDPLWQEISREQIQLLQGISTSSNKGQE